MVWFRYFDAEGQLTAVKGICELEQGYDEAGNLNLEVVLDGEGNRALHPDGWCEHRTTYDENKQKVSERYYGIDGEPVLFKDDYSGVDRKFDEAGNTVEETYYDASGKVGAPMNSMWGFRDIIITDGELTSRYITPANTIVWEEKTVEHPYGYQDEYKREF